MNNGIWALVAVCSGLLLGELGGRLVRAARGGPDRPESVRSTARAVGSLVFWSFTAVGLVIAVGALDIEALEDMGETISDSLPNLLLAAVMVVIVMAVPAVAAVGKDGTVEEGKVGAFGMGEAVRRAHRIRQRGRGIDEIAHAAVAERQAELRRIRDGVKGAAIGNVAGDAAVARHLDSQIEHGGEGGYALEADLAGLAICHLDADADQSAGTFEADMRDRLGNTDQPLLHRVAAERDGGVAAHGRPALIVHEEHGEVGAG